MNKYLITKKITSNTSEFQSACCHARVKSYLISEIYLSEQSDPFFSLLSKSHNFKRNLKIIRKITCVRANSFTGVEFFLKRFLCNFTRLELLSFEVAQQNKQKISTLYLFQLFLKLILDKGNAKFLRKLNLSYSEDLFDSKLHYDVCHALEAHRNLEKFQFNIFPLMEPYLAELDIMKKFFEKFSRMKKLESLSFELFLFRNSSVSKAIGPYLKKISSLRNFQINGVLDNTNNNNSSALMTLMPFFSELKELKCLSLNHFNYFNDEFYSPVLLMMNKVFENIHNLHELDLKIHFYVNKQSIIDFWSFLGQMSLLENLKISLLQQISSSGCIKAFSSALEFLPKLSMLSFTVFGGEDGSYLFKEDALSELSMGISNLAKLKYLKLFFASNPSANFGALFEHLGSYADLACFKFRANFQKRSEIETLFRFLGNQKALKNMKLVINRNASLPRSIYAQFKKIVLLNKELENICFITGESTKRDEFASVLIESLPKLRKIQLNGVHIDENEWKNLMAVLKRRKLEKVIVMGNFESTVDIDEIKLIATHGRFKYVRITAMREEKFPYTYELNDPDLWLS